MAGLAPAVDDRGHETAWMVPSFGPKLETRKPKPETRSPKPETRKPQSETRDPKSQSRIPKPETRNPKSETRNSKSKRRITNPETRDPKSKPETWNLEPETRNPKQHTMHNPCSHLKQKAWQCRAPSQGRRPSAAMLRLLPSLGQISSENGLENVTFTW